LGSGSKQATIISRNKLRTLVIQKLLDKFAYTYSFGTTICSSLYLAIKKRGKDQDFLLIALLKPLLSEDSKYKRQFQHFSRRGVIVLTTAIFSGWITTTSSEGLDFSAQILLNILKEGFSSLTSKWVELYLIDQILEKLFSISIFT